MNLSIPKIIVHKVQFKHVSFDKHRNTIHLDPKDNTQNIFFKSRPQRKQQQTIQIQLQFPNGQTVKLKLTHSQIINLRQHLLKLLKAKKSLLNGEQRILITCYNRQQDILCNNNPSIIRQKIQAFIDPVAISYTNSIKNYRIISVLGEGAIGRVLLARSLKTGRYYAIKVISKTFLRSKDWYHLIQNQLVMLKTLKHPNIIKLDSCFQTDQFINLVLQYCQGGNLFSLLPHLTMRSIKFITLQLLKVLNYLHINQIVYRDLKPQNVLFNISGQLRLCDFKLAKFVPNKSDTFTFCGSAPYSAPQIQSTDGHSIDADCYSLGIMLTKMLQNFKDEKANDFVAQLLKQKGKRPLVQNLINHPWFISIKQNNITQHPGWQFNKPFAGQSQNYNFFMSLVGQQLSQLQYSKFKYNNKKQQVGMAFYKDQIFQTIQRKTHTKLRKGHIVCKFLR